MANFVDELLVKIGLTGDREFRRQVKQTRQDTERETKKMGGAFGKLAGVVKLAIGGVVVSQIARATKAIVGFAEQQRVLASSSERLAKSIGQDYRQIEKAITKGMNGAISRIDALKFSNQAILLGLPVTAGAMEELSRTALRLGRAMNLGPTASLESLVVGIGRQSKLWLDNLGIIVDTEAIYKKLAATQGVAVEQLSDAEKKLAFFNATMDAARTKSQTLGEVSQSVGEKWAALSANAQNLGATIGEKLIPVLSVAIDQLNKFIKNADRAVPGAHLYASLTGAPGALMDMITPNAGKLHARALLKDAPGIAKRAPTTRLYPVSSPALGPQQLLRHRDPEADARVARMARDVNAGPASASRQVKDRFGRVIQDRDGSMNLQPVLDGAVQEGYEKNDSGEWVKKRFVEAAEVGKKEFVEMADTMGESLDSNLMRMEAQMQALGLKGKGIFGGVANIRAGLGSLGVGGGDSKLAKSISSLTGQIAGVGQVVGGAMALASFMGIGGPSLQEQLKGKSNAELREIAQGEGGPFGFKAGAAEVARQELGQRQKTGSQTVSGTVTTLTDMTGKMMLSEISSQHSLQRQYLPYLARLESIDINMRAMAGGGVSADTYTRNRSAVGVG